MPSFVVSVVLVVSSAFLGGKAELGVCSTSLFLWFFFSFGVLVFLCVCVCVSLSLSLSLSISLKDVGINSSTP